MKDEYREFAGLFDVEFRLFSEDTQSVPNDIEEEPFTPDHRCTSCDR